MRYSSMLVSALLVSSGAFLYASGCGGSKLSSSFNTNGGDSGTTGFGGPDGSKGTGPGGPIFGDAGVPTTGPDGAPIPVCPSGLQCDVACSGGGTTTVSGKVFDPAGKNPLYNVTVYVPAVPLQPLPKGVPTGAEACSCGALFSSGAVVSTATAVDGSFTLKNVPVGGNVPLVIQIGKWRRQFNINVTACQDNAQPSPMLSFPATVAAAIRPPASPTSRSRPVAPTRSSASSCASASRRASTSPGRVRAATSTSFPAATRTSRASGAPRSSRPCRARPRATRTCGTVRPT